MNLNKKRIGMYLGSGLGLYDSLENWNKEIALAKELGVGLVRLNCDAWKQIQPDAKKFDFTVLDILVDLVESNGMDLIFTTPISAPWNSGTDTHVPTTDMESVRRLVATVAARYQGRIKYYEAWNEPDLEFDGAGVFWKPAPDAKAYAAFLKVVHDAVKAHDPAAKVLLGGIAMPASDAFLKSVLAESGGKINFDIANVHIYPAFATPKQSMDMVAAVLGAAFPVMVTETSSTGAKFDTTDRVAEEHKKSIWLARTYNDLLARENVVAVVWHCLRNPAGYDYGLLSNTWDKLPAFYAHKAFFAKIGGGAVLKESDGIANVQGEPVVPVGDPIYVG